ncbi:hypothetical protein IV203_012666 [Nitzschia inconspicua]|uniref:Uncharacterized protein n=1 Tax=Nitzschia inconspicua TaxID=303405 RepID=A0A9K3PM54_9STRA|nr:hypothetical protein IV203_012666 [Nitzschia inconspicua]
MRKCKLRPGVGCKATILTKFIHPKQSNIDASHRSTVVLLSNEKKTVGRKSEECYTFRFVDGNNSDIFYAVKTHFKIVEEGRNEDFFDSVSAGEIRVEARSKTFKEPKMKWRKSKAKRILYNALLEGIIPVDDKNFQQMSLEDVYSIDPELALYDYSKLKNRLNRLRNKILELDRRADDDLIAFNNYKKNHKPSLFSHKGFIQWQGSSAQEHLWDDLEDYVKDPSMKPMELWKSRPEYMNEFPLDAFQLVFPENVVTEWEDVVNRSLVNDENEFPGLSLTVSETHPNASGRSVGHFVYWKIGRSDIRMAKKGPVQQMRKNRLGFQFGFAGNEPSDGGGAAPDLAMS